MNIRELEYYVKITEVKNLTLAAEQLYVTQPTLSKYIERLEDEVGTKLFEKVNRTIQLTYAGERYLEYAKKILAIKHDLDLEMNMIVKENVGTLKIGIPAIRSGSLLPKVLPVYKKEYPEVDLQIIGGSSQDIDAKLKEGKIDLAIYIQSELQDEFNYEVIGNDKLGVILSPDHPLADQKGIYLNQIMDETILIQKRSTRHGQLIQNLLEERKFPFTKVVEDNNIMTTAILAHNGYGVAFLSEAFIKNMGYEYCELLDADLSMKVVAAYRKASTLPQYALRFIELAKEFSNKDE